MTKKRSFFLIFILLFSSIAIFDDAYGHSMFNSAEKFEAGNNSAGTRVRKAMQNVKSLAQNVRLEVQAQKNGVLA